MTDRKFDEFLGWSVRYWSIVPEMSLKMTLFNFRSSIQFQGTGRWAKVGFFQPKYIEFLGVKRDLGQEIDIEKASSWQTDDGFTKYEILTSRDGKIVVVAKQASWSFQDVNG